MAGLMDFLQSPAAVNMAASLLESGGPSPVPIGTGQAIGRSLLAYQQGSDLAMQRKLREAQIAKMMQQQELEQKQEQSWQNIGAKTPEEFGFKIPQGFPWSDAVNVPEMRKNIAASMFPSATSSPANVREWEYYNSLPDDQRQQYLSMKRADQWKDLGNQMVMPTPGMPGQVSAVMQKGLPPQELPSVKGAQEAAKQGAQLTYAGPIAAESAAGRETGKATGEAESLLEDMTANMPRLTTVVKELSGLGKKATYTMVGQGVDTLRRQAGVDVGEAAIARKEYISKVDNEILPLLRQTFGAQFTEKEGQSLKATLGDPNASPAEKDAVLTSFIETKKGQIESLRRRTKTPTGATPKPGKQSTGGWGIKRLP